MDTIYAEATPPGRGGVSIIRISGPEARAIAEGLAGEPAPARTAALRVLRDGDEVLDQALVLRFDPQASFTGEEVVELHLHGAPVVVARVGEAIRRRGARLAEAGEFTKRAFLAGRMDLTEIEGLGDLLAAETEAQRRQAMQLAAGKLRKEAEGWREALVTAGGLVAASIDFPEEDALGEVPPEALSLMHAVATQIDRHLSGAPAAERVREGFQVAILGAPNVGKSTLLNRIARRDLAIVTDIPGTTRDVLEFHADLGGLAVTFLDTAGLRVAEDRVEAIGVRRARERAEQADLRIFLLDGPADLTPSLFQHGDIVRRAKADLAPGPGDGVSGLTGAGVDDLLSAVAAELQSRVAGAGLVANRRQAEHLARARDALRVVAGASAELIGEGIRAALSSLEQLVGLVGADDYLDVVFSRFCIGK